MPDACATPAWDRLAAELRTFVARRIDDPADVDDVVQETLLRMHRTHRALPIATLAAALLVSSGALAHDPVPAGVTPLFGADGELVGGYANFGFVLLEDAEPRWVCEEVLPRAETDVWLAPDGALVVSTRGGVHRSTDGGCTWEAAAGLDTLLAVAGLAPDPTATTY